MIISNGAVSVLWNDYDTIMIGFNSCFNKRQWSTKIITSVSQIPNTSPPHPYVQWKRRGPVSAGWQRIGWKALAKRRGRGWPCVPRERPKHSNNVVVPITDSAQRVRTHTHTYTHTHHIHTQINSRAVCLSCKTETVWCLCSALSPLSQLLSVTQPLWEGPGSLPNDRLLAGRLQSLSTMKAVEKDQKKRVNLAKDTVKRREITQSLNIIFSPFCSSQSMAGVSQQGILTYAILQMSDSYSHGHCGRHTPDSLTCHLLLYSLTKPYKKQ